MTTHEELELLDILDTAAVPTAGSTVDRVRLLADENARLLAALEERRKVGDYGRLLAMLDEDRSEVLMLLADCCLDADPPRPEEAKGWGWLATMKKWPTRCKSGWRWFIAIREDREAGNDELPTRLFTTFTPEEEEAHFFPSAGAALRAVVDAIAAGKWKE